MLNSIRAAALLAAASFFTSGPALADSSTPTVAETVAAQVARLTRLLTLTTAQATSATSTLTIEVTALNTISTSLTTAETALRTAVEANSTAGITAAATTIGTLTMQQQQAIGTAEAAIYVMLSATQQPIYAELLTSGLDCTGGGGGSGGPQGHH